MVDRSAENMRLMSKLADRVLRSAEREDEMDKERRLSRSVQDELLKVTSRIANIKQTQSECEVKEKELQEEMESEKNRRETARRKIRVVTEIRNDWHHKNRQRDVINTGYRSQVMMLNVQKAKLQRQIEENSDNGKERIERSILEHADIRSLERELYSSEKENERLEEKLRTIDGKVDKEEQKIMHMADKVKREVNQACVQAIAEENRLVILRTELVPLAAKRMDILSIIEDVRTNAEIARQLHEKEKKSLLSRIKSEESANDEIMRRIQGKSSMNDVVLDLEEVQKEKMDIQKSIDNVNDVNISLQKEIHELEEILVEGTANLAKYNAETESMIFEIEEKRSEIDILTSKISNATVRAGRFDTWKQHESIQNSRLQNKIFEIENTKRRLYSLEKEDEHVKNRLKKRIRDLSETIKKDTEKCVLQQQIAANLHERYEELYESLQIVTRRYEKTHKMVREVNEEISRRKSKFERKRLIRAEATQELKDKIAENDMKIVNLQDQKRAENEEVRGIQDAVDSVLEDAKQVDLELNDKIMELTDRERELSQMLRHIIARNGILESEVSNTMSRSTKSHKLEVEVKDRASNVTQSVKKESFHLEQRIKTEIGKIDHLRSDIHALNNRRNEIHMEFEKLDYIRRQISSHYRSLKDSDSNATLHLEDIKEDEIDLQGRVETLEQQHGFIRKHVHDKIQSLGKARSNLITKKSHLKALKDNLSECELWHGNTLLNLERQRLKIRALTKEIKDQAEQYEQDAAVVRPKLQRMHKMADDKTQMISRLERAEQKLRNRIKKLDVDLEQQMREFDVRKNSYLDRLETERRKISKYKATLDRLQNDIVKCNDLRLEVEESEMSVSARLKMQISENMITMNEVRMNDKKRSSAESSEGILAIKERDRMQQLANVRKSRSKFIYEKDQSKNRTEHFKSQLQEIQAHNARLKKEFRNIGRRENALLLQIKAHRAHIHIGGAHRGHEEAEKHAEKSFGKLLRLANRDFDDDRDE